MKKLNFVLLTTTIIMMIGCSKNNTKNIESLAGQSGSLARFAVNGNYLYTVDANSLRLFGISNPSNPTYISKTSRLTNAETIFIRDDSTMFIGSQDGMYIYNISTPTNPQFVSLYSHIQSCDPVVADKDYAFVTLRTNNSCRGGVNQLDVVDITDLTYPFLAKLYPMTNPKGLGLDANRLYICEEGLKVYDRTDVNNIVEIDSFQIPANDVIAYNDTLLVVASDGFYQYVYTSGNLNLLSKLSLE